MTDAEYRGSERRDDIIAGEYVVGVVDAARRRAIEARMARDPVFAARVARWQSDLHDFNDDYAAETPPASIERAITARLFADDAAAPTSRRAGIWHSLGFWRGLAAASVLVAAVVLGRVYWPSQTPTETLIADLRSDASPIDLVALYDTQSGNVSVRPAAAGAETPRSLELWLIEGDGPPVSLGTLPQSGNGTITIAPVYRGRLAEGATMAVSIEPLGGSPTGAPTGPVVAAGTFRGR